MSVIYPRKPIYFLSSASVVGNKEYRGPLGSLFDAHGKDDRFGKKTWEEAEGEMQRLSLVSALEKAALVTEERIAGSVRSHVRLEITGGLLKVSATSASGAIYDEVAVQQEGPDIVIAFNNRFLIDSVRACDSDKIKISLSTALTSINIEPGEDLEGKEEIFMILPVRMKE